MHDLPHLPLLVGVVHADGEAQGEGEDRGEDRPAVQGHGTHSEAVVEALAVILGWLE